MNELREPEGVFIGDVEDIHVIGEEPGINLEYAISLTSDPYEATTHHHPIIDGSCDYEEFAHAVDSTREGLRSDSTVFIHCAVGVSRSAAVVATALAAEGYYDNFDEALAAIEDVRPIVNPVEALRDRARYYLITDGSDNARAFKYWIFEQ